MPVLEKRLQTRMRTAAKRFGLDEREIMNRAISSYLAELDDWFRLKDELRLWDALSAETMRKYRFC